MKKIYISTSNAVKLSKYEDRFLEAGYCIDVNTWKFESLEQTKEFFKDYDIVVFDKLELNQQFIELGLVLGGTANVKIVSTELGIPWFKSVIGLYHNIEDLIKDINPMDDNMLDLKDFVKALSLGLLNRFQPGPTSDKNVYQTVISKELVEALSPDWGIDIAMTDTGDYVINYEDKKGTILKYAERSKMQITES